MIAYKVVREDGTSSFASFRWPLPDGGPGAWVEATVDPCRSGVHACRVDQLPPWLGPVLYEVQLEGLVVEDHTKLVAPRGRLLRRVEAWDVEAGEAYAHMCAERAHALAGEAHLPEWEVVVEPLMHQGPAAIGFAAARIAEAVGGPEAYRAERARQAAWLAGRLGLTASA